VSGYLDRLAARAAGTPATAAPRVPALFEVLPGSVAGVGPDLRAGAGVGFEVVDAAAESARPVFAADSGHDEAPRARPQAGHPDADPERSAGVLDPGPGAAADSATVHPALTGDPGPESPPSRVPAVVAGTGAVTDAVTPIPATPIAAPPHDAVQTGRVAVGRVPASPSHVRDPVAQKPAAPAGPDVVHVTIGRVDVRATVLAPPAPAPAAPPREAPVALHDYLARGRSR
jgi:hypothetical protein